MELLHNTLPTIDVGFVQLAACLLASCQSLSLVEFVGADGEEGREEGARRRKRGTSAVGSGGKESRLELWEERRGRGGLAV